ncbi:MAG: hypothetical protein CL849_05715 [Crocinitomicaceae bacterium]|nr:hypothetical protein [Crocinitomicaceae bacterium]
MRLSQVNLLITGAAAIVMFTITGCGGAGGGDPQNDFDRGPLLRQYADQSILPAYEAWVEATADLHLRATEMVSNASPESLTATRTSLENAFATWQKVMLYDFGPAMDRALLQTTNTFPVDTGGVMEDVYDANWVAGTPASLDQMGLPALDFLLFHGSTDQVVSDIESNVMLGEHVLRLTGNLADEAVAVQSLWNSGFRETFVEATGTDVGSGIGMLLNAFNRTWEANVRKEKLGFPAGISTFSQTPLPGHVEAPFNGSISVSLIKGAFASYRDLYLGTPVQGDGSLGLDDYLRSLGNAEYGEQLDSDIQAQLVATEAALEELESPLSAYVVDNQNEAFEVYAELQALVVLWKLDMMSAFGVAVTYQDNDGD